MYLDPEIGARVKRNLPQRLQRAVVVKGNQIYVYDHRGEAMRREAVDAVVAHALRDEGPGELGHRQRTLYRVVSNLHSDNLTGDVKDKLVDLVKVPKRGAETQHV
jgi:hypothetical protein